MAKKAKKTKKAAAHLAPPAGVTATVVGTDLVVAWEPAAGATKYSVGVEASYDIAGDGALETVRDHDVEATASPATVPLATFNVYDDGVDGGILAPKALSVKVKALNPGKGGGRQDHPFSVPVKVTL